MTTVFLCHCDAKDLTGYVHRGTTLVKYDYSVATVSQIQDYIKQVTPLGSVRNFGIFTQNKIGLLSLCADGSTVIDQRTLRPDNSPVRKFFRWLMTDRLADGSFIDFFLLQPINNCADLSTQLQAITKKKISVRFISRFTASDLPPHNRRIVDVYIKSSKMRTKRENERERMPSAIGNYERIRVVGKGAFGSAVLYRRREDDSLVVIKEINMHDLSATERQLAMNEVSLLSRLDHLNIISYFDSFEEDGILMIEMEYADGGNLAQFLSRCSTFLPEEQVNYFMQQMFSAVAYLHENNVLHRDLKTANIFLTRDGEVKIGDFGISKLMGTETIAQGAKTVVGTPYYISPEMCEGKPYNEKSDIWALGCILYEMTCLQKAFDGENLPALVNKIMKCSYDPIRGPYSNEIKILIRDMLKFDATVRPTARKAYDILTRNRTLRVCRPVVHSAVSARSSLYSFDISTISLELVDSLPARIHVKQVSISDNHQVLVTSDEEVYTWGTNGMGQLGHGDTITRLQPTRVDCISGKNIKTVAVGKGFSLFCAGRGTVLFCGSGKLAGNGKRLDNILKPTLIDGLLSCNIIDIGCGDEHCVAITEEGGVYVWGNGEGGRLGSGDEIWVYTPMQITLPVAVQGVHSVRCGPDATALITVDGMMLAMGNNRYNKLNLAQRQGFFTREASGDQANIVKPTLLKPFAGRIVDAHIGRWHSGVILESGHVYLFGRNLCGELGMGHIQHCQQMAHSPVKSLLSKTCLQLICGDAFSMVSTADNELYFWGSKGVCRKNTSLVLEDLDTTQKNPVMVNPRSSAPTDRMPSGKWGIRRSRSADKVKTGEVEQIVPHPSLVLRMDSSESSNGSTIRISSLSCSRKRVFVVIDTTVLSSFNSSTTVVPKRSASHPTVANDTKVDTWLQKELDDATFIAMNATTNGAKQTVSRGSSGSNKSLKSSDEKLMAEIEKLKKDMMEQTNTFQGHQQQMTVLQSKLAELQSRQLLSSSDPPPAYDGKTKKEVVYNRLFPENSPSKSCVIL